MPQETQMVVTARADLGLGVTTRARGVVG